MLCWWGNVVCCGGELMLGPVVSAWPTPAAPIATIAEPVARTAPAAMRLNQRLVEPLVFVVIVMVLHFLASSFTGLPAVN